MCLVHDLQMGTSTLPSGTSPEPSRFPSFYPRICGLSFQNFAFFAFFMACRQQCSHTSYTISLSKQSATFVAQKSAFRDHCFASAQRIMTSPHSSAHGRSHCLAFYIKPACLRYVLLAFYVFARLDHRNDDDDGVMKSSKYRRCNRAC